MTNFKCWWKTMMNHNPNWPYVSDDLYGVLIVGGSGSGKTNMLINLVRH